MLVSSLVQDAIIRVLSEEMGGALGAGEVNPEALEYMDLPVMWIRLVSLLNSAWGMLPQHHRRYFHYAEF